LPTFGFEARAGDGAWERENKKVLAAITAGGYSNG